MPATIFDPGGCGCPGPSCFISAVLSACVPILFGSPFSIAGITVNVYDSAGGMLLDTGTTNARGFVAFTIGPGTYFVETVGSPEGWLEFAGTMDNRQGQWVK